MQAKGRAAAVVAAVVGLTLSGCSAPSTGSDTGSSAVASGSAPTGVTLTMWHNTADSKALLNLYKAYEKASGNKIQLVDIPSATFPMTVQSKWATGARPDILEWHGNRSDAISLNPATNMVDLSSLDFVKKEGALATLSGNVNGKTYAATLGPVSVFGIFYNKKVFADAGLSAPQSYADLASDCKVLKSKASGVAPIYEAGGSGWPQSTLATFNYMGQYNVDAAYADSVVAGKTKLDASNSEFTAGMTSYLALKSAGCFNSDATTGTWENSLKAVLSGKAAMVAQNSDSIGLLNADANGDTDKVDSAVGFAPVSATKPIANLAPSPLGTYYVPKTGDATKQRAAIDFIQYVTGKGYQTYVNEAGVIPTLSGTTTPALQGIWQEVQKATTGAGLTINSAIPGFSPLGQETGKLLAGQQTPAQVAAKMQDYFETAEAAIGK